MRAKNPVNRYSKLDNAISPDTAKNLADEIAALEVQDITQIRRYLNTLLVHEFDVFWERLNKLQRAAGRIKYFRKPAGKSKGAKEYKDKRIQELIDQGELDADT